VRHLNLSDDSSRIRSNEQPAKVIDDELVPSCYGQHRSERIEHRLTIRSERRPDYLAELADSRYIPQDSFFETGQMLCPHQLRSVMAELGSVKAAKRAHFVAGLEQVRSPGFWYFESHGGCKLYIGMTETNEVKNDSMSLSKVEETCRGTRRSHVTDARGGLGLFGSFWCSLFLLALVLD